MPLAFAVIRTGLILTLAMTTLGGCTTVAKNPYDQPGAPPSPSRQAVDACTPLGHLQCIYLTGRETLEDAANLQYTFHWWRMSYIGRACEKQYGRTTGVILEALFAIPHYTAMAIGNALGTLAAPFHDTSEDRKMPAGTMYPANAGNHKTGSRMPNPELP